MWLGKETFFCSFEEGADSHICTDWEKVVGLLGIPQFIITFRLDGTLMFIRERERMCRRWFWMLSQMP